MKSRWSDIEEKTFIDAAVKEGLNRDLAMRVYTTRLLGSDPKMVLHGGGNTSVKTVFQDLNGADIDVICVKGSGWDMGTIEAPGLPALHLEPLRALAQLDALSDVDMVRAQRSLLIDPASPNPSVEAILHALVPAKHVDHTHANAIVSLTNQPNGEALTREVFPDSIIVPYVMPGFDLAKTCARYLADNPNATSMVLIKHGIFTWSDDPRQAYDDMIALVDRAERKLVEGSSKPFTAAKIPNDLAQVSAIAPILRGQLAVPSSTDGQFQRMCLVHRSSERILQFCNADNLTSLVSRGNATPEHVLHIKRTGVALPVPQDKKMNAFANQVEEAVADYVTEYTAYFDRNNKRVGGDRVMLDPRPRVFYVPGIGLFAAGASHKAAEAAADVAEATIEVITQAEGMDSFEPLSEEDLFNIEYWSLEQIKMNKGIEKPLARQVAVVTGGAGGLGFCVAQALKAEGAEIALLDIAEKPLMEAAAKLGALPIVCDVTHENAVQQAIATATTHFGGVDILISNAGAAFEGAMVSIENETFKRAFDLNFWSHHYMARHAVRVMQAQGTGGALVFNISKQSVNPGPNFGPYGTSKAALMALMKQYAVEHGAAGITSNGVNADRIKTGLMTDDMVAQRSKARGLSQDAYMRGNLVEREVTGQDVADAFLHLAKVRATTGAVITVDGGNVAAMMR